VKCSPKNLVFNDLSLMAIFGEIAPAMALKCSDPLSLAKI